MRILMMDNDNKKLFECLKTNNIDAFKSELYKIENRQSKIQIELLNQMLKYEKISEETKIKAVYILVDAGLGMNTKNEQYQTCLHVALDSGNCSVKVVNCLLQCGCDLTITDQNGLCAYNYAKRLQDKTLSTEIINLMKFYYPTYKLAIDNQDINQLRRLINIWCRYMQADIDYAKQTIFSEGYKLLEKLKLQIDLCFAVFAGNFHKIKTILNITDTRYYININFKNMFDRSATVKYYAITENDMAIVECLVENPKFNYFLNDFLFDENNKHEIPFLFDILQRKSIKQEIIKRLVPANPKPFDVSMLRYKGKSLLRYAIEIDLDIELLAYLIDLDKCYLELATIRDADFKTPLEFATELGKRDFVEFICNNYIIENCKKSKDFRMQLAYNGFNFSDIKKKLLDEGSSETTDCDLHEFCNQVDAYQQQIIELHNAVELNNYDKVADLHEYTNSNDLFFKNLIDSKTESNSQTTVHRAVLNQNFGILEFLLEHRQDDQNRRLDSVFRDHCYRTPLHYAYGMRDNKRMNDLLLEYGFSEYIFDKDGISPLDFQERNDSEECEDLIELHKNKRFDCEEPNPWSWQVWTRLQQEKLNNRQMVLFSKNSAFPGSPFNLHNHLHHHHHHPYHHQQTHQYSCVCEKCTDGRNYYQDDYGNYELNPPNSIHNSQTNCKIM